MQWKWIALLGLALPACPGNRAGVDRDPELTADLGAADGPAAEADLASPADEARDALPPPIDASGGLADPGTPDVPADTGVAGDTLPRFVDVLTEHRFLALTSFSAAEPFRPVGVPGRYADPEGLADEPAADWRRPRLGLWRAPARALPGGDILLVEPLWHGGLGPVAK